jgi:hypothetical protein
MYVPVSGWLVAFVVTLVVEIPIGIALLRRAEPDRARLGAIVAFANLATHPAVWFVFPQVLTVGTVEYIVAAEAWAIAVEAVFYAVAIRGLAVRSAVTVALVANAASFLVGRLAEARWPELFT